MNNGIKETKKQRVSERDKQNSDHKTGNTGKPIKVLNIIIIAYLSLSLSMLSLIYVHDLNKIAAYRYPAAGSEEIGGIKDMVLVYSEGDRGRNWTKSDFLKYLVHYNNDSVPDYSLFDGFLFMALYDPITKTDYYPGFGTGPGNITTWKRIADKWFKENQDIHALADAVEELKKKYGILPENFSAKVVISIPWPDPSQENFGNIPAPLEPKSLFKMDKETLFIDEYEQIEGQIGGNNDTESAKTSLNEISNRILALKWMISYIEYRWFKVFGDNTHVKLVGYYWINERISRDEIEVVKEFNKYIHDWGRKSYWIPYYMASGIKDSDEYGFDGICMQPNLFFDYRRNYSTPVSRVNITSDICFRYGWSVEFEMDEHLFSADKVAGMNYTIDFLQRRLLYAYMYSGVQKGHMKAFNIYYQGVWTLRMMIDKWNGTTGPDHTIHRRIYNDFCSYVYGNLSVDEGVEKQYFSISL